MNVAGKRWIGATSIALTLVGPVMSEGLLARAARNVGLSGSGDGGEMRLAQAGTRSSEGNQIPTEVKQWIDQANAANEKGAYADGAELWQRILAWSEKALGPAHPFTATSLNNLAFLYASQGAYAKAEPLLLRGITSEAVFLRRELPFLPEDQRAAQLQAIGNTWEVVFGNTEKTPTAPTLALFTRLNRQGLLQDIEQRQALLARSPGPQRELAVRRAALTNRLAAVNLPSQQRQALQLERSELEKQLYRLLPTLEPRLVQPEQVAATLPADGVLVEFQKYRPFDGKKPRGKRWGAERYLALVLRPDGAIRAVQLGEAAPIDAAVGRALAASAESLSDAETLWAQVSRQVLAPLQPYLAGSRQWFLSLDSELNRVPFAALPAPQDPSRPLAEVVQLRLLTTGRELLRLQTKGPPSGTPLVVADPAYDRPGTAPSLAVATASSRSQQRSAAVADNRWAPLPQSAIEGQRIAAMLATKPVLQEQASVERIQNSPAPQILHIATHGFFAPDQAPAANDPLAAVSERSTILAPLRGEDPLLRSGLVLAGANQPQANPSDDGYLTAAEAAGLQLEGTELVVLSACSTGQGDIRTGEGVYGLQRALTVAGARSTLLSLWKVDDRATAAFMEAFYTRLKTGAGRAEALAATQAEFRSHPIPAWRHPYYWAAWQLVGDWKPVDRVQ
ncbi:CHAT domain-containing tetratricopeptide repeat protein [Synechococcus sp. EJ6-Ellesmere]|uniref:CHAT domain-containing protein n=1 Tax=Synechococcus sp. EJ6-Ellesmere TaxID=2823734 RepID=UPI0020CBC6F2|nr:CHAT domain-containing tetratricopeptide repeat protein [Synechococcus sp. EJ6-Ellesmere]MCP9826459.1 CHAT domain-containing protein [Synechococcus sp. EJ6-Ellesmere]